MTANPDKRPVTPVPASPDAVESPKAGPTDEQRRLAREIVDAYRPVLDELAK